MAFGPALKLELRHMGFGAGSLLFQDLELSVPSGQVLAVLGPSGIGKTTLLRILAGVETGFEGVAKVGPLAAHRAPAPGFVFQDARLLPWLSAAENLRAVHPEMTDRQIEDALRAVGLAGQGDLLPRAMSGGMQRRLGLARALAVNPGLLLLDEPFASLDRALTHDLQEHLLTHFAKHRATAVLVTHDVADAARLAHRVMVLAGRPARWIADLTLAPPDAPLPKRNAAQIAEIAGQISERVAQAVPAS